MVAKNARMISTRHVVDLSHLNYSTLAELIKALQEIADRPDCDPEHACFEMGYQHSYYDSIDTTMEVAWTHERSENEGERAKRLEANRKARETRKQNAVIAIQKEIALRDELLQKHPLGVSDES